MTTVLIVEDESIVAEDIKSSLQMNGYTVPETASSGKDAIEKAKEFNPDIVLMDIVIKGNMDGIETAKQIRSLLDIPVVYLTAFSDEKIIERVKLTEPFGYLIKPFNKRELTVTLEIALLKHRLENELKTSRKFFESILESIVFGIWVTDKNDIIRYANKGVGTVTGINAEKIIGMQIFNDFNEFIRPYYKKAKESRQPFYFEAVPFINPDGSQNYKSGWLIPKINNTIFDGMVCTIESIPRYSQMDGI
jgi:PAS domain S-box-containing protein